MGEAAIRAGKDAVGWGPEQKGKEFTFLGASIKGAHADKQQDGA